MRENIRKKLDTSLHRRELAEPGGPSRLWAQHLTCGESSGKVYTEPQDLVQTRM